MSTPDSHAEFFESIQSRTHDLLDQLMVENLALRELVESLQAENDELRAKLGTLEKDLGETRLRRQSLEENLREIQQTREQLEAQYFEVEQQNLKLTNLYVASYQIHGTLVRDEVLANIQEILVNLIGTECYAIYEAHGSRLELVRSLGAPFAAQSVDPGEGPIGRVSKSGEIEIGEFGRPADGIPVVVVPLRIGSASAGVIAIFSFIPHKSAIDPIDHELFDLLATHAGTSLYCTRLYESHAASMKETA